jgi:hypothetical protein
LDEVERVRAFSAAALSGRDRGESSLLEGGALFERRF